MGLRHWAYAAMLAFCLVGTLPLQPAFGLRVLQQVRRLCVAILPVAVVFVVWDLAATHAGQWRFDPAQTLPPRLGGLPLEEIGFFLVIPLAGILSYEAVRMVRGNRDADRDTRPDAEAAAGEDGQGHVAGQGQGDLGSEDRDAAGRNR